MKIGFISKTLMQNNPEALACLLEHCLKNNHNLDLIYSDHAIKESAGITRGNLFNIIDRKEFFNSTLFFEVINKLQFLFERLKAISLPIPPQAPVIKQFLLRKVLE